MKKIILLLIVLVPFSLFGQAKLRKGYIATQDGDSISCLYQNGLWVLESDTTFVIKVDTVEFPDGTKLFTASTETVGTRNGAYKSGNFIEFGTNPLIKDTELPGGGFDLDLGTTTSKLELLNVNADDIKLYADNKISIKTNDVFWEWYGDYITGQRFGAFTDTLISKREVEDLISQINVNVIQPWNFEYEYGATYDDSRPGAGLFKMNNAFIPNVTEIYIDDFELGGTENSSLLQTADTGSYFFIYNKSEDTWRSEIYAIFQITGGYESNSGYTTYNVNNIYDNDPPLVDGDVFELVLEVSNSTGSSSGGSIDAGNAVYDNNGTLEFGTNPLYKNTEVPGASYNLDLGTTSSKIGEFDINSARVKIYSDNALSIKTDNVFWEWEGDYITGQRFGAFTDTLISARETRELLAAQSSNVILPGSFEYEFVSTLTDTRPGVTTFSFNSAVASSVTRINIDDFDLNSDDKSNLLQPVDTGSYLTLFNKSAQTWPNEEFLRYKITGGYVDESGYTKYNVTFIYDGGVDLAEGDVFVLVLDQSNSTGSGGGGSVADSVASTYTALDTLKAPLIRPLTTASNLSIESTESLSIETLNGAIDITSEQDITAYSNSGVTIYGTDITDITGVNGVNVSTDASVSIAAGNNFSIQSGSGTSTFDDDTLRANGITSLFKNVYARLGGFIGQFIQVDKVTTDTFSLAGVEVDSIIELKFAVENESFDKLTFDTTLVNNDTITPHEYTQAFRKILYPNDYASYLPNDSIYTTPSITVSTPTKVLIPTAVKYSRNWNLFDKGGGDFALRFEGVDSSKFHITMTTSMRTSASNVVFEIFMYKNGVIEPGVAIERKIGTGADVGAISVTGVFDVAENDYIEVYVLVDVTTTITFSKTSIVIKEDGLITN